MPTQQIDTQIEQTCNRLIADLRDRRGLKQEWNAMDRKPKAHGTLRRCRWSWVISRRFSLIRVA